MWTSRLVRKMSNSNFTVPIIDASKLLSNSPAMIQECKKAVEIMHKTGIMILRDPRVNDQENEQFLDLMEKYYESRSSMYYKDKLLLESNPQAGYQTGIL